MSLPENTNIHTYTKKLIKQENILKQRRIIYIKEGESLTGAIKKAMLKEHNIRLTRTELIKLASSGGYIEIEKDKKKATKNNATYGGKNYKLYNPVYAGNAFILGAEESSAEQNKSEIQRLKNRRPGLDNETSGLLNRYPNAIDSQTGISTRTLQDIDTALRKGEFQRIGHATWKGAYFIVQIKDKKVIVQIKDEKVQVTDSIDKTKKVDRPTLDDLAKKGLHLSIGTVEKTPNKNTEALLILKMIHDHKKEFPQSENIAPKKI